MSKYKTIFVVLIIFLSLNLAACGKKDSSREIDKLLGSITNEYNKTLPIFLDAETRLDNTMTLPGGKLMYSYTLPNWSKSEFSYIEIEEIKNEISSKARNGWKTDPSQSWYRENKIELIYKYRDKDGNHFFEFSFIAGQ